MNFFAFTGCLLAFVTVVTGIVTVASQVQQLIDVAIAGQPTELACHTSEKEPVVWRYHKLSNTEEITLWRDGKIINQDYVNLVNVTSRTSGDYNLLILRVEMGSSGLYTCVEESGIGISHQTQLVVFASAPVCETNLSSTKLCLQYNDVFEISCHVSFAGNCVPVFECLPKNPGDSVSRRASSQTVWYSKRVVVSHAAEQHEHTCSMSFNCSNSADLNNKQMYNFETSLGTICADQLSPDAVVTSSKITQEDPHNEPMTKGTIILISVLSVVVLIMAVIIAFVFVKYVKKRCPRKRKHDPEATELLPSVVDSGSNTDAMKLPEDVLEDLLLKSFFGLVSKGRKTHQAERDAYRTLCSVSSEWCAAFGGCPDSNAKRRVKHRIKHLQEMVFFHYRRHPVKSAETTIKGFIYGIACVKNNIFILSGDPNEILIFDEYLRDFDLGGQHAYIEVQHLKPEIGIAACCDSDCVYVGDSNEHIWRLTTKNEPKQCMKLRQDKTVHRLMSVTNRRLLILSPEGYFISRIPSSSKGKLFNVSLNVTDIKHAVETKHTHPTIIVSHFRSGRDHPHQITEYDGRGQELRHFGSEPGKDLQHLNKPGQMILDMRGQIVLADTHNDRVLLFDEKLQEVERILLNSSEHKVRTPLWLSFNEATGQLIVGEWLQSTIYQFDIQKPRKFVHADPV